MAREQALAANVAPWILDFERRRRPGARLLIEQQGALRFATPAGEFTLTAKADRIELRGRTADVLDFKTGAPPSLKEVRAGLAPQLTLTGAILSAGGFEGAGRADPGQLVYVRVSGGRTPGVEDSRDGGEAPRLAEEALTGLKRLIARYDTPTQGYASWIMPKYQARYGGDYDHLARLWEWAVTADGAGDSAE